jgi:hypothetical protein
MSTFTKVMSLAICVGVLVGGADHAEAKRSKPKALVVRGAIGALSPSSVVINSREIRLTSRTKLEDFMENLVTLDAFAVGDCVKVKLVPGKEVSTAREMELEAHCKIGVSRGVRDDNPSLVDDSRSPAKRPAGADDNGGSSFDDNGCDDGTQGRGRGRAGR